MVASKESAAGSESVSALLGIFAPLQRAALQDVRETMCRALPGAEEAIAWGMPSLRIDGDFFMSYQGFSKHNTLFPGSAIVHELVAELSRFTITKGSIHFGPDSPLPAALVRKIIVLRIGEINESYPRSSGVTKCFYPNGFVKYRGRIKAGEMHGGWEFFRKDGSLMRTGEFRAGEKCGIWRTFSANGLLATEKSFH